MLICQNSLRTWNVWVNTLAMTICAARLMLMDNWPWSACIQEMKTHHSPLGDPNERMTVTKLQRKDCVTKIMPVDDDLGSSHPGDKPDNREGRDARRVLAFEVMRIRP